MAMQMFKQTAIEMSRSDVMKGRVSDLLNGAETIVFFDGQDGGEASLTGKTPFSRIDIQTTTVGASPQALPLRDAAFAETSTLGRTPPSGEPPTTLNK
jgi:hypothetical protein